MKMMNTVFLVIPQKRIMNVKKNVLLDGKSVRIRDAFNACMPLRYMKTSVV
jgi:hypothetical protein